MGKSATTSYSINAVQPIELIRGNNSETVINIRAIGDVLINGQVGLNEENSYSSLPIMNITSGKSTTITTPYDITVYDTRAQIISPDRLEMKGN